MDKVLEHRMKQVLFLFIVACAVITLFHTPVFSWWLLAVNVGYTFLVLVRDFVIRMELRGKAGAWMLILQLALVIPIVMWSESFVSQIYLLILIGEFSFYHTIKRSLVFTIVAYVSILAAVGTYRPRSLFEDLYLLLPRVIDFFAIFGMSVLARVAYQQRAQLAEDNERLHAAARELEEKARLQERTRISREIHDSVGHTLTSASMGLQTAIHAIHKDKQEVAMSMLERTASSIRRGLSDMRNAIHLLRDEAGRVPFREELLRLANQTEEQAEVHVRCEIEEGLPALSPLAELAIYRALQEGLTNGIRHGQASKFQFILSSRDGGVTFLLTNDGAVPEHITYGFGLNAMKERVDQAGGEMSVAVDNRGTGASVALTITLPLKQSATTG